MRPTGACGWFAAALLAGSWACAAPPVAESAAAAPGGEPAPEAVGNAAEIAPKRRCRFVPDRLSVHAVQRNSLNRQIQAYEDVVAAGNGKPIGWLDRMHERLYCLLDDGVRWIDTLGLPEDADYEYKASRFRLVSHMRAGGRSNEKDFDFKVRFNAKMALPRIQRELYLFVDNVGRDMLPGSDPMTDESDTRVGLAAGRDFLRDTRIDVSAGLRLRSTGPVLYGDLDWIWDRQRWGGAVEVRPERVLLQRRRAGADGDAGVDPARGLEPRGAVFGCGKIDREHPWPGVRADGPLCVVSLRPQTRLGGARQHVSALEKFHVVPGQRAAELDVAGCALQKVDVLHGDAPAGFRQGRRLSAGSLPADGAVGGVRRRGAGLDVRLRPGLPKSAAPEPYAPAPKSRREEPEGFTKAGDRRRVDGNI